MKDVQHVGFSAYIIVHKFLSHSEYVGSLLDGDERKACCLTLAVAPLRQYVYVYPTVKLLLLPQFEREVEGQGLTTSQADLIPSIIALLRDDTC